MQYEVSGIHLAGFVKAARQLGVLDAALAKVSPAAREVLSSPHRKSWVPASTLQELSIAISDSAGPERVGDVNYLMSKDSMGPIVMPLLKVAMALTGRSPATVFSRMPDLVSAAMRGVTITWEQRGDKAGTATMRYPVVLPRVVHFAWHGVFRFGFELAGADGRIAKEEYLNGDTTLRFELEWS